MCGKTAFKGNNVIVANSLSSIVLNWLLFNFYFCLHLYTRYEMMDPKNIYWDEINQRYVYFSKYNWYKDIEI